MIFNQSADGRKVRQFSLSNGFLAQFAGKQPAWGALGYFTYKRTYARDLPDGGTEEFWQTCQRVVEGCFNIQKIHCHQMGLLWNESKAQLSAQDMFGRMWGFKFTPPGRGLAVMGTDIVYQRGSASLQNCAFVSSEKIGEDFAGPFTFLMDMSMLGVGVGGDTRGAGKVRLVMPRTTTEPYVVQDSREGWVDLVKVVLNSFVGKGAFPVIIDYSLVRGRGTPLKTFGGTASGPKPLHDLVENITKILLPATAVANFDTDAAEDWATIGVSRITFEGVDVPYRITSPQIVDIFNFIGKAVVAGGIRRTAEIMFGESDDQDFMALKQDQVALNDRRWACVTGDTMVDTKEGSFAIASLIGRSDVQVLLDGDYHQAIGVKNTGNEPVFHVETFGGPSIKVTENHQFMTSCGWVCVRDLKVGDKIVVSDNKLLSDVDTSSQDYIHGYLLGALIGDGTFTKNTTTRTDIARIMTYTQDDGDPSLRDYISQIFDFKTRSDFRGFSGPHGKGNSRYYFISAKGFTDMACEWGVKKGNKTITQKMESGSCSFIAGVASGLFDADGTVPTDGRLAMDTVDKELLLRLQRMLIRLGIHSRIYPSRKEGIRDFLGVKRKCRPLYRIILAGYYESHRFMNLCHLHHSGKRATWDNLTVPRKVSVPFFYDVAAITPAGTEDVFDICVPSTQAFPANGLYVHNSNNSVFGNIGMDYTVLAQSMAVNGEPGVVWLDNARKFGRMKDAPDNKDWRIAGTNPCVTGDTITMTEHGPQRVDSLLGKPFNAVVNGKTYSSTSDGFFKTGNKPVYLLETEEGYAIKVTEDHEILTALKVTRKIRYDEFVPAGDLAPGDMVVLNNARNGVGFDDANPDDFKLGWLLGSLLGDGHFHQGHETANLEFWGPSAAHMIQQTTKYIEVLGGDLRYPKMRKGTEVADRGLISTSSRRLWNIAPEYGISHNKDVIGDQLITGSRTLQAGFIRGLFDADGSVQGNCDKGVSIRLASSTMPHLTLVQRMLVNLGITSVIYANRRPAGETEFRDSDGNLKLYPIKAQHELCLVNDNIQHFAQVVGFSEPFKNSMLAKILVSYSRTPNRERFVATFKRLTYIGVESVYDCTIPEVHRFVANGILVHNCGEQGLESYELCVGSDTYVQMKNGVNRIGNIVGEQVAVWNGDTWSSVQPRVTGENRELFRVELSDGSYLDCTSNHGWHVKPDGKRIFRRVDTCCLTIGDQVVDFDIALPTGGTAEPLAFEIGLFVGDGYIDRPNHAGGDYTYPRVVICGDKVKLQDLDVQGLLLKPQVIEGYANPVNRLSLHGLLDLDEAVVLNDKTKGLTAKVFGMNRASILEFVAGWIETDGTIVNKNTSAEGYRIYGVEPKMRDLQLLLRRIGINHSCIRKMADAGDETNFGVRNYALWYCQIPSYECAEIPTRIKVASQFGNRFASNNAHPEGVPIDRARKQKVVSVIKLPGLHTTYCFDEPDNHMAVFGNVLTYQCNLVETYPAHHDSYEDFERTLKMAYLYAKTVTLVPTHDMRANAVMTRNRRIGCSMSGIVQAMQKFGRREFLKWCDNGYKFVQQLDRTYSDWLGIPLSVKTTTVKPSGTVSLLCGATPGIHYPHSEYYIRHIRVSNQSPLCEAARKAGYDVFPDKYADETSVVAFPVHEPYFVKGKAEVSIWEQFVNSADLQKHWSDNLVSATVTFNKEEVKDIKACLESFETRLKGISMLPLLEEDHGYFAPPYMTINQQQFEAASARVSPMVLNVTAHDVDDNFCSGDKCLLPSAR